jgi:hypothetical protein
MIVSDTLLKVQVKSSTPDTVLVRGRDPASCEWSVVESKNIPGEHDLVECTEQGDIREDSAKVATCREECVNNNECRAIVFHAWGTMLKKSAEPQVDARRLEQEDDARRELFGGGGWGGTPKPLISVEMIRN